MRHSNVPMQVGGALQGVCFSAVAAGTLGTVAVTEGGLVYIWGNFSGDVCAPEDAWEAGVVPGVVGVEVVACGDAHLAVVDGGGEVSCWGESAFGQLGLAGRCDEVMCLCVCVCLSVCMYVCVCVCVCVCMYVCMYVCVYVCIYVCMYVCM